MKINPFCHIWCMFPGNYSFCIRIKPNQWLYYFKLQTLISEIELFLLNSILSGIYKESKKCNFEKMCTMPLYSFKHPKSNPTILVSVVKDSVHQEKEIEYKFECPLCHFKTDFFFQLLWSYWIYSFHIILVILLQKEKAISKCLAWT